MAGVPMDNLEEELQQETLETLRNELETLQTDYTNYKTEKKAVEDRLRTEKSLLKQRNVNFNF